MLPLNQVLRTHLLVDIAMDYIEALITSTEVYLKLLEEKAAKISSFTLKSLPRGDQI